MTSDTQLIHSLTSAELADTFNGMGFPSYRADQVYRWLYVQMVSDWSGMKNIPVPQREKIAELFSLDSAVAVKTSGESGQTRKILVGLRDGETVEEVLIPGGRRRTVCISSQIGCRRHCAFCASGQGGFQRDLEAGEMVGQVLLAAREYGEKPTNVVVMGMGEPFDNYDAVLKAVRIINDAKGLGIGARHITISTSGVIPGIERLAGEGIQVELSVSLHAPEDALRSKLMPVNRKYPLKDLLKACGDYTRRTKRIITFEYVLINGVNDQPRHADALACLLRPLACRVNLIPLSPVEEFDGKAPAASSRCGDMFISVLKKAGLNATLRESKGSGVKAACGQLRRSAGN